MRFDPLEIVKEMPPRLEIIETRIPTAVDVSESMVLRRLVVGRVRLVNQSV